MRVFKKSSLFLSLSVFLESYFGGDFFCFISSNHWFLLENDLTCVRKLRHCVIGHYLVVLSLSHLRQDLNPKFVCCISFLPHYGHI